MKDVLIKFYVNKFVFLKSEDESDVSFLPPILKRRLSKLDKCVLSVLKEAYTPDIQNIVFSSQYGEVERLIKLINQYQEEKEVSPNIFSGSVHNYPIGFFLLNEKNPIPYTAISSSEQSLSSGLLTSVISNFDNILYCYADINNDNTAAMALNISKNYNPQGKLFQLKPDNKSDKTDYFDDYSDLFEGRTSFLDTSIFRLERIINEK